MILKLADKEMNIYYNEWLLVAEQGKFTSREAWKERKEKETRAKNAKSKRRVLG